ncbi:hypothetical protein [Roseisalinus antarcticus]|uniref:AAA+ family ATPase n=1 Tax=Roseisalinus antarcticus TaxID=254357 RepID=A0A1Y5STC8_9RHOB|nr:hypothetical protein [Roseisalinus antarcticus]SLN47398.1 hypothetical protein ROA7023_01988 [Roseisalinus antarcticus]
MFQGMKPAVIPLALIAALAVNVPAPVTAQEEDDGFSLMEEGGRLILRGLMEELGPALEDLEDLPDEMRTAIEALASEAGPAIMEVMRMIDEIRYYEAPEILDNGDIILRRKPDAPPYEAPAPEEPAPGDSVDL